MAFVGRKPTNAPLTSDDIPNGIITDYTNFNLKQYTGKEQVVAYLETLCEAAGKSPPSA